MNIYDYLTRLMAQDARVHGWYVDRYGQLHVIVDTASGLDIIDALGLAPDDVTLHRARPFAVGAPTYCGFRTLKYRPVPAGVDIGVYDGDVPIVLGCSVGVPVKRLDALGFLTANHCTVQTVCGRKPSGKEVVVQPGPVCGGTPADAVGRPAAWSNPDYDGMWLADAAFVESAVVDWKALDEKILRNVSWGGARDPRPGEHVVKFGRGAYTFSTRVGTVLGIGAVAVSCNGSRFIAKNQIITTYISSEGDSGGGLYMYLPDGSVAPAGIVIAGNDVVSAASPISEVAYELGISTMPIADRRHMFLLLAALLADIGVIYAASSQHGS